MPEPLCDPHRPLSPLDRPPAPGQPPRRGPAITWLACAALAIVAGCSAGTGPVPSGSTGRAAHNISRALPAATPPPGSASSIACLGTGGTIGTVNCGVTRNASVPVSLTPTSGFNAAQLRAAYGLAPVSSTAAVDGPLVAVVDPFDDASAESDLAKYRSTFGIPACTSANGCFTKVVMPGAALSGTLLTLLDNTTSTSWADEFALDLAMVSASCPTCRILLVEAAGQDLDSLAVAVNAAAGYHPAAISNSWGVAEAGNAANIDAGARAAFDHPGIAITASAGDGGQIQFPASSPYVTAVGGTTLTASALGSRGWSETVWNASGNGCSTLYPTPAWQTAPAGCAGRAVPDVSMIADCNPGVTVYSAARRGWVVLGGTSIGAPFVAGLYAAANDYGAGTVGGPRLYAGGATLNPVSGASQGSPYGLAAF